MEFFDIAYVAQLLMQLTMTFTYDPSAGLEAQLASFIAAYRQAMIIGLCVAAGIYLVCLIMGGIGMHVMAKKRGMKGSWIAFLPFGNTFYAGKLAGETNFFGKKVKWMGLAAMLFEIVHVGLSIFSFYILFSFMQPEFYDPITTSDGLFGGAEFVSSKLPVGMRWMLTADAVCEILIYVFYLFMLLAMCMMFYSFYRKYYARSPFVMMFLSALLPFRGFVIFAVRNNTPVDYDAWMRQRMEEFNRRQQQNRPGNYGGYGGYGGYGTPNDPGSSNGAGGGTGENPFPDFGGSNGSNGSGGSGGGDSPFSDF